MAWRLKGHYVTACTCTNVCPCPTASAPPDNPDGTTNCWGGGVFDVREGNLDDLDLSDMRIGITVHYPSLVSDGNWQIAIFVDESASEDQYGAIEKIFSGQLGGNFADMSALVTDFSIQRSALEYSESMAGIGGVSFTYEPLRGPDGNATTVTNAAFGFAPVFEIGRANGTIQASGHSAPASYGEAADFEYTSGGHEHARV